MERDQGDSSLNQIAGLFKAPPEMEGDFSSKWMMWIGGIALAFGGAFLVKYSIDSGLLHPAIRVALGATFGLLLVLLGDWARRKQETVSWLKDRPSYMPGAIAAGGLFTLFASVYSSYALYQLVPATLTFILLALISLGASWLARKHGKYFAYIGLVAGMAVPLLVSAKVPSAWGLFPYLLAIVAACLWGARKNRWTDVTATTLGIASLWTVSWIITNWHAGDILPVGLFVLALGAVNQWMLRGASIERTEDKSLQGILPTHVVSILSDVILALCAILITGMVRLEHYSLLSLAIAGTGLIGVLVAAVPKKQKDEQSAEYDMGLIIGLIGSLFLLATWHLPSLVDVSNIIGSTVSNALARAPIQTPGFEMFLITSIALAILVGSTAYGRLKSAFRKSLWSIAGAGYPLAVLLVAFWRMDDQANNFAFAVVAAIGSALFAIASEQCNRRSGEEWRAPLAAYAAGATGALSLALAILLEDAWLSFALAAQVMALGYIWKKTGVQGLRTLALGLSVIVLARLFFNVAIFDYGGDGALPIVNWLWYGYGLTSLMFAYAARLFSDSDVADRLVPVLKSASAMLLIAFTTLEIRVLASTGNNLLGDPTTLEAALQTLNWTAAGVVLYWLENEEDFAFFGILRKIMTVISLFGVIVAGGLFNNIFFEEVNVGTWPILNLHLLQFFVPALLYAFKARIADVAGHKDMMAFYGLIALLVSFSWLTLEVRHLFYPGGGAGPASDWEWYAYSAAWLLYAVGLTVLGMRLDARRLRLAGVGLMGAVVIKVFLFDMNHLEGVARALSFMGLGVVLIATGYLYQYFRHQQLQRQNEQELDRSNQFSLDG